MINYEEAFGIGVVEALACGTSVIAINRGAMPELIMDGETGFLVNSVSEAVDAVEKINSISRRKCRESVEESFSVDRMVEEYIRVYEIILEKRKREAKKPWGFYEILTQKPGYKVKRITVLPQEQISLQRHAHRNEHWYVVSGEGLVIRNSDHLRVLIRDTVDIPVNEVHRVRNPGVQNLVFIEIAEGDYLGEDDIERLEDKYGRA